MSAELEAVVYIKTIEQSYHRLKTLEAFIPISDVSFKRIIRTKTPIPLLIEKGVELWPIVLIFARRFFGVYRLKLYP